VRANLQFASDINQSRRDGSTYLLAPEFPILRQEPREKSGFSDGSTVQLRQLDEAATAAPIRIEQSLLLVSHDLTFPNVQLRHSRGSGTWPAMMMFESP